jgi:hypothetical protein
VSQYCRGSTPTVPNLGEKTSCMAHLRAHQQARPSTRTFWRRVYGHGTLTQSWAMGLHLHEPNYAMGGDLIHKLIKVVQGIQVLEPPTYCKNHHERLHHYEQVSWSRIIFVRNDHPGMWPSKQRIRSVTTDKQAHLKALWRATMQRQDPFGFQEELGDQFKQLNPLYYSPMTIRE